VVLPVGGWPNLGGWGRWQAMGRFMSPDPIGGHQEDPQTLNRYSYVRDNPLTLTDPTGLDFNLGCDKNNGTTCQGGHVYYQDQNGKYQETVVKSDDKGNLTDQSGNKYSGTFDGKNVTFTNSDGTKSSGSWIQGSNPTSGIKGGGALDSRFQFTFSNHGASQLLHFDWTFAGTVQQARDALTNAGYDYRRVGADIGYYEYRTPTDSRNSTHVLVDRNFSTAFSNIPGNTVPTTFGSGHYPEFDPLVHPIEHAVCDIGGLCQ
jgi:hypothetical protein